MNLELIREMSSHANDQGMLIHIHDCGLILDLTERNWCRRADLRTKNRVGGGDAGRK